MSIRNLIPYLKSKNNEIVDCFVEDGMISLLRLFYLPSNSFFILDITSQQIPLDSSFAEQVQVSVVTKLKEFEEEAQKLKGSCESLNCHIKDDNLKMQNGEYGEKKEASNSYEAEVNHIDAIISCNFGKRIIDHLKYSV